MFSDAFGAITIAFLATAGAIPLMRGISPLERRYDIAPGGLRREVQTWVAGVGMLVGVLVSRFYIGSDSSGLTALAGAGVLLAGVAEVVGSRISPLKGGGGQFSEMVCPFELAASIAAGIVLVSLLPTAVAFGTLTGLVFAVAILATPAAIAMLGRVHVDSTALPAQMALIQLLLLAVLRGVAPGDAPISDSLSAFLPIGLPVIGALLGGLIFLSRMPWRAHPLESLGVSTRLNLGLVVVWGAICIVGKEETFRVPVVWILAVPVFELVQRYAFMLFRGRVPSQSRTLWPTLESGKSPKSKCLFTLLFGGIAITATFLHVDDLWMLAALMPAWLIYLRASHGQPY